MLANMTKDFADQHKAAEQHAGRQSFCSFGLDKHDQAQVYDSATHFAVKKYSCYHHRNAELIRPSQMLCHGMMQHLYIIINN